jgi:hypothetical protein
MHHGSGLFDPNLTYRVDDFLRILQQLDIDQELFFHSPHLPLIIESDYDNEYSNKISGSVHNPVIIDAHS